MDTNTNTQQLNTFGKGMVADISDALLGNDQYRLAKNLRYITDDEENTGELHIIEGARYAESTTDINIMASTQIRQYGVLITGTSQRWSIQRFENPYWEEDGVREKVYRQIRGIETIFGPCTTELGTNKPSLVTTWEDEDNVKVYIADGKNPLMSINIVEKNTETPTDIKYLTAFSPLVFKKPIFCGLISGKLKAGLVEYSYQFYTKHGHQSEISPSTRLIPLHTGNVDLSGNVSGYEMGTTTDKGVRIQIDMPDVDVQTIYGYTHVKVYRITYVENGMLPSIEVFYDQKLGTDDSIVVNDIGQQATELLSLEEYNSMSGIHIIPRVIESMNDYLFASNIKEYGDSKYEEIQNWEPECTYNYKSSISQVSLDDYTNVNIQYDASANVPAFDSAGYYGGDGNVSWRFTVTTIDADACTNTGYIDPSSTGSFNNTYPVSYISSDGTLESAGNIDGAEFFNTNLNNVTYANPSVSYYLKSLKRDELYRYGIILYDDIGNKSGVKWIADIRVPNANIPGFEPFVYVEDPNLDRKVLKARPLGIKFTVNNLPEDSNGVCHVIAYEIVRCGRSISDIATITQGVLSRPIKRISDGNFVYPYTPSGFLTTDNVWMGRDLYLDNNANESNFGWSASNFSLNPAEDNIRGIDNKRIFQFVSPEVCYESDTLNSMVDKQDLTLVPLNYIYPIVDNTLEMDGVEKDAQQTIRNITINNIGNEYARIFKNSTVLDPTILFAMFWNRASEMFYYGRSYGWTSNGFENLHIRGIADRYSYIKLYNYWNDFSESKKTVDQIKQATTYKWDEFAEQTTDGEDVTYNMTYNNKLTSIGGDNFNNWVIGGSYDVPYKDGVDSMYWSNNGALNDKGTNMGSVTGPGGKCFVLSLREDANFGTSDIKFGTVLCNIRQNVVPYGGSDAKAKETCSYNSYGNYFDKNDTQNVIFDGDCFLFPFEYVSQHKCYFAQAPNLRTACIMYALPVESNINLAYTYGYEFSKNRNNSAGDITNIQVEADNVNNKFTQYKDLYLYNSVYSANSNTKVNAAEITTEEKDDNWYDYRTYFSNKKSNNEPFDNWTKFMPANYLDVDTRYGAITGLRRFHNQLVFWQEEKTGLFSVEERAAISDDSNMPLILGTGGVLTRYDYMATSNGMHKDQFCDAQSDSTLYWWDYNKHELCAHSGGMDFVVLSKVKMIQNLFNKSYNTNQISTNPVLTFDKRFNELLAHVDENRAVVYSESMQAFSGVYDIKPTSSINFLDRLYFAYGRHLYEWNQQSLEGVRGLGGGPIFPYLKWVVNDNGTYTKVFDNAEFGGRVYGGDKEALRHLTLRFSTPLKQHSDLSGDNIENREYNFRYVIPRTIDQNNNKPLYGDRLRGKTMQCELESDSNIYDFSLQFIKTKYRISWS